MDITFFYRKKVRNTMFILFSIILVFTVKDVCFSAGDHIYGAFNNVQYVSNYDGDTITVDIPDVPGVIGDKIMVRIRGIDTPELRGKCQAEKTKARTAKRLVKAELRNAENIDLKRVGRGKYFRLIADVKYDGKDLGQILIKNGLAVEYDGGTKKKDWCRNTGKFIEVIEQGKKIIKWIE
jgi:micrococcal nuclease